MEYAIVAADLIQTRLRLDDDWGIDQLLFDEKNQHVDMYIPHSGEMLVYPETGEQGMLVWLL